MQERKYIWIQEDKATKYVSFFATEYAPFKYNSVKKGTNYNFYVCTEISQNYVSAIFNEFTKIRNCGFYKIIKLMDEIIEPYLVMEKLMEET